MKENIVTMENISKNFGPLCALDQVNFNLRRGSIHGLLGENGAGKTTLMNILYGLCYPDSGNIYVNSKKESIKSPKVALKLGIGMVHQHFMQVRTLTVAENIILGLATNRIWVDLKQVDKRLRILGDKYKLQVNPLERICQLSVGQQQRVEILTALYKGADILILDEPTAVLTPQESKELFYVLETMRSDGKSIILISHKLREIMDVTDECTVLRDGKIIGSLETDSTTPEELAYMMVGREVLFNFSRRNVCKEKTLLELKNLKALSDSGLPAVNGLNLDIHEGEILGLAGVDGNGQKEICEILNGLRPVTEGEIYLGGLNLTSKPTADFIKAGVAYIPEDRNHTGLVMNLNVMLNFYLKNFTGPEYCGRLFLEYSKMKEDAKKYVESYEIKAAGLDVPVSSLSGGNQQKIILARELGNRPKLVVAQQPTRGLDIAATEYVRKRLLEERDRGVGVFLVSTDLDEIWQLSDRIAVIYKGRIMGITDRAEATIEKIGLMMSGAEGGSEDAKAV